MGDKGKVWLLFTQHEDGLVALRAICRTADFAEYRRKMLAKGLPEKFKDCQPNPVIRAWVETAGCDHLWMEGMFELSVYGKMLYHKICRKEA